ncbi:leukocyte tyrosine kinase receptor, partial [Biomphalaria glabrata]
NVPPEGAMKDLDECDFPSGRCLWYNVQSKQDSDFLWEKTKGDIQMEVFNRLHVIQSNTSLTTIETWDSKSYLQVQLRRKWRLSEAILRSVSFEPNYISRHCQIGFWYLIDDDLKSAVLKLELIQLKNGVKTKPVLLWKSPDNPLAASGNIFQKVVVSLPLKLTNISFMLQFKTYFTNANDYGQVALYQVAMSPDCFHTVLSLSSCGQTGSTGPTQDMCDREYDHEDLVRVVEDGHFSGAQMWTVPESMFYRIEAFGSRGGRLNDDHGLQRESLGARVETKFYFEKGEAIYFVIGQAGEDECPNDINDDGLMFPPYCTISSDASDSWRKGGPGGGGATIVFKIVNDTKPVALLIAGGGSGQKFRNVSDTVLEQTDKDLLMSGLETDILLSRSLNGLPPCSQMTNGHKYWMASGGYGLGGGSCGDRGLGGPLIAGLATSGKSYIHPSSLFSDMHSGFHNGEGLLEIFVDTCSCPYHCMWLDNDDVYKPTCLCPSNKTSRQQCKDVMETSREGFDLTSNFVLMILISGLVSVVFSLCCVGLYLRRQAVKARHPTSIKKIASFFCPCVHFYNPPVSIGGHTLPQIQRPPTVMHANPNYDRIDLNNSEQALKEIPRKHLKLMSELGQGAFGEVYYGLLSNVPMVDGDLAVAVKTLPQVCTEQMEMDFLMEAVIVSKFNHPNIVKFIGVCFNERPHYLVLELLEGGDLKSFLLQARPKWEQPSQLTVLDLLRLSLDIARGCQHLEEKHFIHRDIAARNCLLSTKGPHRIAKIADFGMARDIYRSDYYKKSGKALLPVKWMPPEAFLDGVFSVKTDVWSFGILMWEVFSLGHMPYPGCSNEEVMNLVAQGGRLESPGGCPSAVFDIMVSCWNVLPEDRPNFSLIIASLERRLQDDDLATRGLPVFYVAPIVNTRSPRLQERPPSSPHPRSVTSRGIIHPSETNIGPHIASDGYLEPLLSFNTRSVFNEGLYQTSENTQAKSAQKKTPTLTRDSGGGRAEQNKAMIKTRTPRVFYKTGSSYQPFSDAAASESLLQFETEEPPLEKNGIRLSAELNNDVRNPLPGCDNDSDKTGQRERFSLDDLKIPSVVALPEKSQKKKSYTHFPRHSSNKY